MITLTTPPDINDDVRMLCAKIGIPRDPIYVDVVPNADCIENECFPNIKNKIKQAGGRIQYGWTIWGAPDKLIEGEFHAIWIDPNGDMVDITPKTDGETRILFLPDDKQVYTDEPIDNIRLALCDDPEVAKLIRHGEAMTRLRKKYNVNGRATIPEYEIMNIINGPSAPFHAAAKIGRNDPCPCNSGLKYKKCCGKS